MSKLSREQAIQLAETEWWKRATSEQIVAFQLYESKLCMDFGAFHAAVEEVLGRSVWTHEFAHPEQLQEEFEGKRPPATFAEIMALIPEDKRVLIGLVDDEEGSG